VSTLLEEPEAREEIRGLLFSGLLEPTDEYARDRVRQGYRHGRPGL
jgi:hypothetical protein